ncbi:MAG: hypothetical protein RL660_645 [Bacteroidota bacterium]|jgi:tRNA1(Val) A37 N6-methylase TrmN6
MNLSELNNKKKLHQATVDFFSKQLQVPIAPFDAKPFDTKGFFEGITANQQKFIKENIESLYVVGLVDDNSVNQGKTKFKNVSEVANLKADYEGLIICAIVLKISPTRTTISEITRLINRKFPYLPVTIVYRYDDDLLCLANAQRVNYKVAYKEGDKVGKVSMLKDVSISKTHGAHLKILNELQIPKAVETFEGIYTHWQNVFNTKELNKQFFKKIANWYFWCVAKSKFPYEYLKADEKQKGKTNKELQELANQKAAIRFITRMVFVWFLKEKKLVPHHLFEPDSIKQTLKTFHTKTSSGYYNAILQNLFFATLNRDAKSRDFALDGGSIPKNANTFDVNSLYRYEKLFADADPKKIMKLFASIPFLNGGLFDSLDNKEAREIIDGFSRKKEWQAIMPDYLFFEKEEIDFSEELQIIYDKKGKYTVKGLFEIFNEYKFTVEENTPLDVDVALDPYLLGEIFENLLAYYNPETGATARKGTGSFYTPQEIVNYMVSQSLQSYIQTQLPELAIENIDDLPTMDANGKYKFVKALAQVKILDPACGSGAFPMGVLYQMVELLQKVDADNKIWKQVQHDITLEVQIAKLKKDEEIVKGLNDKQVKAKATEAIATELAELEANFDKQYNGSDFARKLYIIQNCIYGVDIQDVAIQISKLRFFLSLIVDQHNKNIQPLPNLETKFVIANTLIGLDLPKNIVAGVEDTSIDETANLKEKLKAIRQAHFTAKTRKEKKEIQKADKEVRQQIMNKLLGIGDEKKRQAKIKELTILLQNEKLALRKTTEDMPDLIQQHIVKDMFGGESIQNINQKQLAITKHKKIIADALQKIDKLSLNTLEDKYKHQAIKIANWDLYNQNASADWFDMEWMFGIKDGFDVVIGNPPYVGLRTGLISNQQVEYFKERYLLAQNQFDLFTIFIEKSTQILNQQGLLTFIIPKTIASNQNLENARDYLLKTIILTKYIDTQMPFEQASVESNIIIALKNIKTESFDNIVFHDNKFVPRNRISFNILKNLPFKIWPIGMNNEKYSIIELISKMNTRRLENYVEIIRGFEFGFNHHSVSKTKTKYPIIKGENIHRFITTHSGYYVAPIFSDTKTFKKKEYFSDHPKLLTRFVSNTLIFSLDEVGFYNTNVVYNVHIKNNALSINFLLGLLNSKLLNFWFFNIYQNDDKIFPHIQKNQLESIPIIGVSEKKQTSFISLVNKILTLKKSNADTSVLEHQIDVMVYHLYNLNYQEACIIDPTLSKADWERYKI